MNPLSKFFNILISSSILIISCNKGDQSPEENDPIISSINPSSGGYNTIVKIAGKKFSTTLSANTVKFNGAIADILIAKSDTLTVKVPMAAGVGPVTVTVNNRTSNGVVFNYTANILVSTIAGNGIAAVVNGPANIAQFNYPTHVAVDQYGNIYVSDYNQVRKITPAGIVTTLAGTGTRGYLDGPGQNAQFNVTQGIAVDLQGNVYVADRDNERIRKIDPNGYVTTLAGNSTYGYLDGIGVNAQFWEPLDVAVDQNGNVYVADRSNMRVRKIAPNGAVTTLAGSGIQGYQDGPGATAQFYDLTGIDVDLQGNVYVADCTNQRIRKISPSGVVSTLAGSGANSYKNGVGINADFANPTGLCVDYLGNVYVGDFSNAVIRKITSSGLVTTLAGTPHQHGFVDGPAASAKFYYPRGVAVDQQLNIFVADFANHSIRKIEGQ